MPQEQQHGGSSVDAGGEGVDFNALFEQARGDLEATRGELGQTRAELEQVRGHARETQTTIDRLKKALSGEDEAGAKKIDRVPGLRAQLDEYLAAALEAERGGRPMPLTTNLAVQFFESQIGYEKDRELTRRELDELKRQLKAQQDPTKGLMDQAFVDIDGKVITALNTIFGPSEEYNDVKAAQFKAITDQVVEELKGLRRDDPQAFDQIMRQPNARAALVRRHIDRNIPPRARAIMEQHALEQWEQPVEDVVAALRNAREVFAEAPSAELAEAIKEMKTEIVERSFMRGRGRGPMRAAFAS